MVERHGHILIVGATSGIGRVAAERFSSSSAITAIGRRQDKLAELEARGIATVAADVLELETISELVKKAVERSGLLTGLVYCAGLQSIKALRSLSAEENRRVYGINLLAPTQFAAAFASVQVSTKDAVFCAVSSIAAFRPEPAIVPYSASKAGLDALIKGLARELAPRRAVGVAPGWLDTEMTQAFPRVYSEDFKAALAKRSPAGIADTDAVVDCIEFLLSPKARFITGEIITIDGGASL